MAHKKIPMEHDKKIALVAHDNKKRDLVEWAKFNRDLLAHHQVFATGTTGKILKKELGFKIAILKSGPLGGDQQIELGPASGNRFNAVRVSLKRRGLHLVGHAGAFGETLFR